MTKQEIYSPLRYPGGKASLYHPLANIIRQNDLVDCKFYEVYAGGAGVSLSLLFKNIVSEIYLNDLDYHIYAFWYSVLKEADALISKIQNIRLTIEEWYKQKEIYSNPQKHSKLDIGFATLFLNRTNRSGVLSSAGPIGGYNQSGNYKISARFYRKTIVKRIEAIANRSDCIHIFNFDAIDFLNDFTPKSACGEPSLFFLDPPYFNKGRRLYLNYYLVGDHLCLANILNQLNDRYWITTYDNTTNIKAMYNKRRIFDFNLHYQMNGPKMGQEIMILSDKISVPETKWLWSN